MKEIELGFGYKLERRDSMNWELMHWHECNGSNNKKLNSGKAKWHRCGKFCQTLGSALHAVYELALGEAERIAATLNANVSLLGLGDGE